MLGLARIATISASELAERIERGDALLVLDVREPYETEEGTIPGSVNIPLMSLTERASELPPDRDIVVACKMGARSARAVQFLQSRGFRSVANLAGGVDAWKRAMGRR